MNKTLAKLAQEIVLDAINSRREGATLAECIEGAYQDLRGWLDSHGIDPATMKPMDKLQGGRDYAEIDVPTMKSMDISKKTHPGTGTNHQGGGKQIVKVIKEVSAPPSQDVERDIYNALLGYIGRENWWNRPAMTKLITSALKPLRDDYELASLERDNYRSHCKDVEEELEKVQQQLAEARERVKELTETMVYLSMSPF